MPFLWNAARSGELPAKWGGSTSENWSVPKKSHNCNFLSLCVLYFIHLLQAFSACSVPLKSSPKPKTSVAPGRPSMLCLRFCFVLCRPWFPIFNPCYVINFKLEFLRPDRTKCLETWYHYCILPNLKNSLLQFLEKMSLLEDACLGLDFPFLALAMI